MIDFHNHLIPGVDDGAENAEETLNALKVITGQGVTTVICTPHLKGSVSLDPPAIESYVRQVDAAWNVFLDVSSTHFPNLAVHRGAEILLDVPRINASDPRVRLAGTKFALVEFSFSGIPPKSEEVLFNLKVGGTSPIVAHPERYEDAHDLGLLESWRRVGAFFQVNAGSFLGRYGRRAESVAWQLLRRGWIDYISSDYHARGTCYLNDACQRIARKAGEQTVLTLTQSNGSRLLQSLEPIAVEPIRRKNFLQKLLSRG